METLGNAGNTGLATRVAASRKSSCDSAETTIVLVVFLCDKLADEREI